MSAGVEPSMGCAIIRERWRLGGYSTPEQNITLRRAIDRSVKADLR
jgi:hypothetical protein